MPPGQHGTALAAATRCRQVRSLAGFGPSRPLEEARASGGGPPFRRPAAEPRRSLERGRFGRRARHAARGWTRTAAQDSAQQKYAHRQKRNPMRVAITIDSQAPHRDRVRDDAEFWCGSRARAGWRAREREDSDGREVLAFEFDDPLDATDFGMRTVASKRQGRLL